MDNENLYVTISADSAVDAVDVSAVVNEGGEFPIRYTEYSDSVFTAENVLLAISYNDAQGDVHNDTGSCEVRNNLQSSTFNFISANTRYVATRQATAYSDNFGVTAKNELPLTSTFNYTSSATNRILVASQMGTSNRAIGQAKSQQRLASSQVGK